VLRKVAEGVKDYAKLERAPVMEGRALSIMLAPDKVLQQQQQRKQDQPVAAAADGAGSDGANESA
jgi:hypothetical protein